MRKLIHLLCLVLSLSGCAAYWIPDASVAGLVEEVQYVTAPCGSSKNYGCYSKALRLIQINSNAPKYMQEDALSHEYKHSQGFIHEEWPFNGRIHRGDEF